MAIGVLLYSGGMDSVILDKLFKPAKLLYINILGKYSYKELTALPSDPRLQIIDLNLSQWERQDSKVPCRNAIFALIASIYGDPIYLAATAGDRTADKSPEFAVAMNLLMAVIWRKQVWTKARQPMILLPLRRWTKTECVRRYLKAGGDSERLIQAPSCYNNTPGHCGQCNPCIRKWTAFRNNNLSTDFFQHNPRNSFTSSIIKAIQAGKYRGEPEDSETVKALEMA